jgi:hypothetical protein
MSTSCFDALTATEQQVKNVAAVIAKGDIPSCISVGTAKLQADMKGMNDQLQSALSGFTDNNKYTVQSGVRGFRNYLQLATTDYAATDLAQKKCFTIVLPTWVPY